jgi:hypothetical protein
VGAADDVNEDEGVKGDERCGSQGVDTAGGGEASDEDRESEDGRGRGGLEEMDRGTDR